MLKAAGSNVTQQSQIGDMGRGMAEALAGYLHFGERLHATRERRQERPLHRPPLPPVRGHAQRRAGQRRQGRPGALARGHRRRRPRLAAAVAAAGRRRPGRLALEHRAAVGDGGPGGDAAAPDSHIRPHPHRDRLRRPHRRARAARALARDRAPGRHRRRDVRDRRGPLPAPAAQPQRRPLDRPPAPHRALVGHAADARRLALDPRDGQRVGAAVLLHRAHPAHGHARPARRSTRPPRSCTAWSPSAARP